MATHQNIVRYDGNNANVKCKYRLLNFERTIDHLKCNVKGSEEKNEKGLLYILRVLI